MKNLFFLLLFTLSLSARGATTIFENLQKVNQCWAAQPDVPETLLQGNVDLSEKEWIRAHLALVESILRKRHMPGLSAAQQHNRILCLDLLHNYWQAGKFPVNDEYASRTPIFIDKYDNFCAVGYLVMASGNEQISRMIAARTNLDYVRQMRYPELTTWAAVNGFSLDELAWIQPGYPPAAHCGKIGEGVNGSVQELFVDASADRLYVGGSFTQADDHIAASNIAYVTEEDGVYSWHSMGTGVSGPVNAIIKHDNKIFVAGSFTQAGGAPASNIAWWDGASWHSAGCVAGVVNDLAVFEGNLYAAGKFNDCLSPVEVNFAKWNGTYWQPITGLTGRINTMQATDGALVMGGAFAYGFVPANAVLWNESASFQPFANTINNEVMDVEMFQDTLYAVCKRTNPTDTGGIFLLLRNGAWRSAFPSAYTVSDFYPYYGILSINALCNTGSSLELGGQFQYAPMMGISGANCYNIGDYGNWVAVDSAINKMVLFKGELIMGGKFKFGNRGGWGGTFPVNGIAKRITPGVSVPSISDKRFVSIYPNPVRAGSTVTIENNFGADHYTIHHITGKLQAHGPLTGKEQLQLGLVPAGMYMLTIYNEAGEKEVRKIMVE